MALGADACAVEQSVLKALEGIERAPADLPAAFAQPAQAEQSFEEPMDTAQGKLCLLFTAGQPQRPEKLSAARVAVALLGGTATSRLFVNVREKRSLCYYCAASYASMAGLLCIDSGVEHQNAKAAKQAILEELDALKACSRVLFVDTDALTPGFIPGSCYAGRGNTANARHWRMR